jgi:hypothetical protein
VGATTATSPTVAVSPGASQTTGATPTDTSAAGINQGPGSSFTPDNSAGDSSNSADNPLVDALLIILLGAGSSGLIVLIFLGVRAFLRKRLIPLPSPKLPPSGAAPWSRSTVGVEAQPAQSSPYAPVDDNPFYQPPMPVTPPLLPGNVSADMMVVSNPYLQAMPYQDSQQGQIVQQVPEEYPERW